jgi:E3 ubiquitin-protein ligase DOA10
VTPLEKYQDERKRISEALKMAGVVETLYNKDNIPKKLPCAILILDSETGKNGTSRQYVDTDIVWTVFLIVNAQNVSDPDSELYSLKEKFRSFYLKLMNRDLPSIEYYTSRIDGTRLVRIAKIDLLKSGSGAGS